MGRGRYRLRADSKGRIKREEGEGGNIDVGKCALKGGILSVSVLTEWNKVVGREYRGVLRDFYLNKLGLGVFQSCQIALKIF